MRYQKRKINIKSFEKRNFLTCIKYVAKMLKLCHEEFKDFELELSWILMKQNNSISL